VGGMKRNREEIISQILNVCKNGAIKTKVVYQANLNFKTVEPYLDLLVKNNLLVVQHGQKKMYETTEKGENLLEALNHVNEISGI
jgi:predicted transcriptional regulator